LRAQIEEDERKNEQNGMSTSAAQKYGNEGKHSSEEAQWAVGGSGFATNAQRLTVGYYNTY
jgi:hypothetical protein